MADLGAVLRKTIDALPAATPQLRAKVYEKARTAIQRQISAASPPLSEETVEARQRALEDAIASTEAHYVGAAAQSSSPSAPVAAPPPQVSPATAAPVVSPPIAAPIVRSDPSPAYVPPRDAPRPPLPSQPTPPHQGRPHLSIDPADANDRPRAVPVAPPPSFAPSRPVESPALRPARDFASPSPSAPAKPSPAMAAPIADEDARVGEIGPMSELPPSDASPAPVAPASWAGAARTDPAMGRDDERRDGTLHDIPQADMAAPAYTRPRARRSNGPLFTGLAALLFVGGLGAAGYLYSDEISAALNGTQQAATSEAGSEPPAEEVAAVEPPAETPADPAAVPGATAPPAAPDPGARQFTQRLLPDGTEVDEGPAESVPNAFDEGTDVAAASPVLPTDSPPVTEAPGTETAAVAPATDPDAVPVGQRAVFYEERSEDRPGSQRGGNVVWSVVSEPPAAGEPAEPAIRAVADVGETDIRMTMTIRRNADETLPASHVIELLFDTPENFAGGEIENVQRLALKPTEQARGEPLIGVAGRISDGFFIIALNDLQQAVDNNLTLMANQQWIDIPLAYATGQRALMSLEKGIPGERVFKEAMDAWATRT